MGAIWITGAGIVSAIGIGQAETLQSLIAERSGIGPLQYLKTEHTEFPVGEVKLSDEEMRQRLHIPTEAPMTRTALMGMLALEEALADAGLNADQLPETGFISGTTVGGMDMSEQYYLDFLHNDSRNEYIKTHDCGACSEMIADHFGRFAFISTISTACSSAANAILLGANMLRRGEAECVVVGGSECITKFHLNGFNSLMILDRESCRPFDATRAGLNLGEGAAFLVLETEEHARKRNREPHALLAGYGNACDAFHQTASSPDGEGAYRAMKAALQMAGITPEEVDYINAHGTGTPNNDASESAAVRRLWNEGEPRISSTKAFTGHTTSASGSIEAVICLLAMRHRFIPANLNYSTRDENCMPPIAATQHDADLRYVLCNAFGFGGNDTSMLFANYKVQVSNSTSKDTRLKPIYICSASQISIQSALTDDWMQHATPLEEPYHRSADPEFKQFIPPLEARRMGKILKRAIVTSQTALNTAGLDQVDAIITGTGLGCIENTEFFLTALCTEGEQMLKPTHFMQSTHNTISSLAAIRMKCHGYNVTYAHKEFSFDSALYDAYLQLQLNAINTALVGGHDEMTPTYYQLLKKAGYLGQPGEIAGEAAVSFVLGNDSRPDVMCQLGGMRLLYQPTLPQQLHAIEQLLAESNLAMSDIAGVMTPVNGSEAHDALVMQSYTELFGSTPALHYKHLFGESYTASGLALYVAATCLHQGRIPSYLYCSKNEEGVVPKALLLYNTDGKSVSFTLLKATHN